MMGNSAHEPGPIGPGSFCFFFFFCMLSFGAEIETLVRQLDADRLRERNAAETALIELGPGIENRLPEEATLADRPELSEEAIFRLKNVFQELRFQTIRDSLQKIRFRIAKTESPSDRRCWVTLQADWPKEVFPIRLLFSMKEIDGFDAEGKPIPPVSRNATLEIPVSKNQTSGELLFAVHGKAPASVAGNCRVLLALAEKSFEFSRFLADSSDGGASRSQRKGRTTVSVESARFFSLKESVGNESLTIRFRVRFDDAFAALESHRTWIYENDVRLRFRSGKSLQPSTFRPTEQGPNEIAFDATFELAASPTDRSDEIVAFIYTTPTIIVEETIPFTAQ